MNTSDIYQRYQRQISLREIGEAGQQKLSLAKVLVIGAGGLGCPALQYLAAAGVGTLGIVDYDIVDISNLHRQILYSVDDIGKPKAEIAANKVKTLNPEIEVQTFIMKLDNQNAFHIIAGFDLVLDGTDNFASRYLINDACVLLKKPLVYGAVLRFEGQVGVFNLADKVTGRSANYRDLFPEPPDPDSVLSCNKAGVLGVVPGIIGMLQATEAIKIIAGVNEVLCNQIVNYNMLSNEFYKFNISPTEESINLIPKSETEFLKFDYDWFCNRHNANDEIAAEELDVLISNGKIRIIDVREKNELPLVNEFPHSQIPFSSIESIISSIDSSDTIVVFCQTGSRSAKTVKFLRAEISGCKAFSLSGGILAWKKLHQIISN